MHETVALSNKQGWWCNVTFTCSNRFKSWTGITQTRRRPYLFVREQWNPASTFEKYSRQIEICYKCLQSLLVGVKFVENRSINPYRITKSSDLFNQCLTRVFPAGLKINLRSRDWVEPHQTSTPAAAVLRAAQSKTTFASESLFQDYSRRVFPPGSTALVVPNCPSHPTATGMKL